LKWGGHGVLVFDINDKHHFVKRIRLDGYGEDKNRKVLNVKGVCASARTGRLYVSTLQQLLCVDLVTDKVLWQKTFDLGCDRMSILPDGKVIYLPSLENKCWYVVDADTGNEITRLVLNSKSHNTVVGLDGKRAYLAGLGSPYLAEVSTDNHTVETTVGKFGNFVRPFTINSDQTRVFANVNGLLGFEIGNLKSGKVLDRVEVKAFQWESRSGTAARVTGSLFRTTNVRSGSAILSTVASMSLMRPCRHRGKARALLCANSPAGSHSRSTERLHMRLPAK